MNILFLKFKEFLLANHTIMMTASAGTVIAFWLPWLQGISLIAALLVPIISVPILFMQLWRSTRVFFKRKDS